MKETRLIRTTDRPTWVVDYERRRRSELAWAAVGVALALVVAGALWLLVKEVVK